MGLLAQMAKKVQKAGAKDGDTVLAHITPQEAAQLAAMGGSGKKDPKTGLPHFKQDKDGPDNNNGEGRGDTGGGTGNDGGGDNFANNLGKDIMNSVGRGVKGAGTDLGGRLSDKGGRDAAPAVTDVRPSQAAFGATGDNVTPAYDPNDPVQLRSKLDNPWGTAGAALLGLLGGGVPGALAAAGKTAKVSKEWDTWGDVAAKPEAKGGGNNEAPGQVKKNTATVTPSAPPPAPGNGGVVSVLDEYISQVRKRQGRLSTILSSNSSTAVTVGKKALGA